MPDTHRPKAIVELAGKVLGPIVREKYRPILHMHIRYAGRMYCPLDHINRRAFSQLTAMLLPDNLRTERGKSLRCVANSKGASLQTMAGAISSVG